MSADTAMNTSSPGALASNGMTIMCLAKAVRSGESAFTTAPPLIAETLKKGAWRQWTDAGGPHEWGEDQFEQFVRTKPPDGLGVSLDVLEALLKPDSEAWILFHEVTRARPGARPGEIRNPDGINHNIIMDNPPDIIPIRQTRETQEGTSVSYAVRRLGVERPDLLERVKAGELSPNRAMVEAGFRPRTITVPDDPDGAARRLLLHFAGDRLEALIAALSTPCT